MEFYKKWQVAQVHFMHRLRRFFPSNTQHASGWTRDMSQDAKIQSQVWQVDRVKHVTASSRLFLKLLLSSPSDLNEEITVDPQTVVRNNIKILLHAVQYPITVSKAGAQ